MDLNIPKLFQPIFNIDKRYIVLWGGRGSGKSHTVARYLLLKALLEDALILCTREYQVSVKDSVYGLLCATINKLELNDYFVILKTEIRCVTGSRFIFSGLQNIENIKSKEEIKYLWIEEANNLNKVTFDTVDPTIRVDDSQIIMVFNLQHIDDYPYTNFVLKNREDTLVIKANYYDNPFLTKALKMQMEYAKKHDIEAFNHIWLGEARQISDALVFKNKFVSEYFETPTKEYPDLVFYYGADFGYAKDPSTLVRCYILGNTLYIDQEAYGVGIEIDELPNFYDEIYDKDEAWLIIGDNQRPDTISYLANKGYNIKSCRKGKGSVADGIAHLRSFDRIVIHPRCKNTLDEFNHYSYKIDSRTGNVLPLLKEGFDHIIDAVRYSMEDVRKGQGDFIPLMATDSQDTWDQEFFR